MLTKVEESRLRRASGALDDLERELGRASRGYIAARRATDGAGRDDGLGAVRDAIREARGRLADAQDLVDSVLPAGADAREAADQAREAWRESLE